MPTGYFMVRVRNLVSGIVQELYPGDAERYLNHPWFSDYYIVDGGLLPVSGTIPVRSSITGDATVIEGENPLALSGTIAITSGVSGAPTSIRAASGSVTVTSTVSGDATVIEPPAGMYISTNETASNLATFTFPGQDIGPAYPTRRIAVMVAGRDTAATPSSVTIGGIAAGLDGAEGAHHIVSAWSAEVPTGTTADIVITYAAINTFCGIAVWALDGLAPTGNVVEKTNSDFTAGFPMPASLVTTPGGFAIFCTAFTIAANSATNNAEWTGCTERVDSEPDGRHRNFSAADVVPTGVSTDITLTINNFDTSGILLGVAYA